MSNGLHVFGPSVAWVHVAGRSRSRAFSVAGVRRRMGRASGMERGMGVGFGVEWRWVVRYESRGVREEIPDQMTKSPSAMYLANILRTEAVSLVAYTVKPRSISALKASCP